MNQLTLDLIYKVAMVVVAIGGLFIPVVVTIIGVIFVSKSQKRKEEAEAKLTEAQVRLTETQYNKIQKESKDVIASIINEPTIKDITEGYKNLMSNFKIQIEQLQDENKRIRTDFNNEIEMLKKQIEILRRENEELRFELNKKSSKKNQEDI